jgi:hypothetical protein
LWRDWNSFGKEDFLFEIIEECDFDKLEERELWWIEFHSSKPFIYNRHPKGLLNSGTRKLLLKECRIDSKKRQQKQVGELYHYHIYEVKA